MTRLSLSRQQLQKCCPGPARPGLLRDGQLQTLSPGRPRLMWLCNYSALMERAHKPERHGVPTPRHLMAGVLLGQVE